MTQPPPGSLEIAGTTTLGGGKTLFRRGGGLVMTIGGFARPDRDKFGYNFDTALPPAWWTRDSTIAGRSQMLLGVDPQSSYRTYWPVWTQTKPDGFGGYKQPPAPQWYANRVLVDRNGIVWALAPWFDGPFATSVDSTYEERGKANVGFRFDPRSGRIVSPINMSNDPASPYDLFPFSIFQDANGHIVISDGDLVSWFGLDGKEVKRDLVFPNELGWVMEAVGADILYPRKQFYSSGGARIDPPDILGATQWGGATLWRASTDAIYTGSELIDFYSWQRSQSYLGKPLVYFYPENHITTTRDGWYVMGVTAWFGRDTSGYPYAFANFTHNPSRHGLLWIKDGAVQRTTWLAGYDDPSFIMELPWRGNAADPNILCPGFGSSDILVKMPGDLAAGGGGEFEMDVWQYSSNGAKRLVIKNFTGYFSDIDGFSTGAVFAYSSPGGPAEPRDSSAVYEQQRGL